MAPHIRYRWCGVIVAVLGGLSAVGVMIAPAVAEPVPVTPGTPAPAPLVLTLEQDRLSASITRHSLMQVLAALDTQVPLRVYYRGSHAAALQQTTISAAFDKLPLLDGVQRLLEGQNYALNYAPAESSAGAAPGAKVLRIWLMSGTGGFSVLKPKEAFTPSAASQEQSVEGEISSLITTALSHPEGLIRWQAVEELTHHEDLTKNQQIVDVLWKILHTDADPEVRESALLGLAELEDFPFAPIAEVFRTDANEIVRSEALRVLTRRHGLEAQELVQQALQDPNYYVRKYAKYMEQELSYLKAQPSGSK